MGRDNNYVAEGHQRRLMEGWKYFNIYIYIYEFNLM